MSAVTKTRPIVTLTTDFGTGSPYVAQMKGVLLSRNPELHIVDITHGIAPQDIHGGALVLDDVCLRFPPRTIHIVVVDPGVGTDRKIVYAKCDDQQFIAPDNGVLTYLASRKRPTVLRAVTNRLYFLPEVSATFHGRDIMAPVAAHLSLGLKPTRLGEAMDSLVMFDIPQPTVESAQIRGSVIQIDSFGNVITNIVAAHLSAVPDPNESVVRCGNREINGLAATYSQGLPGTLVALVGSGGRLEIAVVHGNAAEMLKVQLDDEVALSWKSP